MSAPRPAHDAVILVGGAGSRLGGVDKAAVDLEGQPLVAASLAAARDAQHLVVVGSTSAPLPEGALVTHEEPPGSGPAAAFVHGLRQIEDPAPWVLLLACDVPGAPSAVPALFDALTDADGTGTADGAGEELAADGAVLTDPDGRLQWVIGLYRSAAVRDAATRLDISTNRSLRALLGDLTLRPVQAQGDEWHDIDTWRDHEHWIQHHARRDATDHDATHPTDRAH